MDRTVNILSIDTNKQTTKTTVTFEPPVTAAEFTRNICVNCNVEPRYNDFDIINVVFVLPGELEPLYFNNTTIITHIPESLVLLHSSNAADCLELRQRFISTKNFPELSTQVIQAAFEE
jgi:hypothetical protein